MLISEGFQQKPIDLNQPGWDSDRVLQSCLRRILPRNQFDSLDGQMKDFQLRLLGPIAAAGRLADGPEAEPTLVQYDHFGQRIDQLKTSEGWRKLKAISHEEGLVAIPMERAQGEYSRVFMFTKCYLLSPYGHYIGCPISMTDGCARVLELLGTDDMKRDILPHLVSRDPSFAWTAGQWMTERPQGSDVSMTETTATPVNPSSNPKPGDWYILDGFKWFSSATDGDVALALARTGTVEEGSKGLSLFVIRLRNDDGSLNGIQVHRLKKKWGTKALPTAELSLANCKAQLIGQPGRGVPNIATVLNITRVWSAMSGLSHLRRTLVIAKGFAQVRHVGGARGSLLINNYLHTNSLLQSELVHRALCHFVFDTVHLLGRSEALKRSELSEQDKWRLRLLTPVVKSFSADVATKEMLALMESLGGQGYMMENEIGTLLADGAVEKIWEGTTNTLSLDILRVIAQSKGGAMSHQLQWAQDIINRAPSGLLSPQAASFLQRVAKTLEKATRTLLGSLANHDPRILRPLLFVIGFYSSAALLLEHASWSTKAEPEEAPVDKAVFEQWLSFGDFLDKLNTLERVLATEVSAAGYEREVERRIVYGPLLNLKL